MSKYKFGDFAINSTQKRTPTEEDYAFYIGLEHMDSRCIKITRWGSDVPIIGDKLVMHKGDILLGKRNAYLRRAAIAPHDGLFSAHGMILRPNERIVDYDFFVLFIASDYFFDEAIRISVGSLSPTINWKDLKELEFDLPDLATQKEIAKVLWSINDTLEEYKNLKIASEKLICARFISLFGDPNDWKVDTSLTDALEIRDDLREPLKDGIRKEMKSGELYPYYGANGVVDYINKYLMDCDALCVAEDCGAYGYNEKTSYIIRGKSWVNNHAHVLIPKKNCDIEYANTFFTLLDLTRDVNGTTRQKLTQSKLKEIKMLIPDIRLQKEFAAFVKETNELQANLDNGIAKLTAIYKKIIEGKLNKED